MKYNILHARIKRSQLEKLAGICYRGIDSALLKEFNTKNKKAIVGIQSDSGMYTILGEETVFYKTEQGREGEIPILEFTRILQSNGLKKGKNSGIKTIETNEMYSIWILNEQTMCAMWNVVLYLEKQINAN